MKITRRDWLIGLSGAMMTAGLPSAARGFAAADRTFSAGLPSEPIGASRCPLDADLRAVKHAIENIVTSVNNAMSPFDRRSEISRFNLAGATDRFEVSASLHSVVTESLRVAAATGGAFDPTVGPLVGRFGFGSDPRRTSWAATPIFRLKTACIRKARPDLTLDLCGIAKGFALDRMVDALDGLGLESFLIELGGEVFGRGRNWRVGIERPLPGTETLQRIVRLDGRALATSGDRYNFLRNCRPPL